MPSLGVVRGRRAPSRSTIGVSLRRHRQVARVLDMISRKASRTRGGGGFAQRCYERCSDADPPHVVARTPPVVKLAANGAGSFAAESGSCQDVRCPAMTLSKLVPQRLLEHRPGGYERHAHLRPEQPSLAASASAFYRKVACVSHAQAASTSATKSSLSTRRPPPMNAESVHE